jgi:poly(A) polymerase
MTPDPSQLMPKLDSQAQRDFAFDVVKTLRAAGFQALWAGGCVRDQLLGRVAKDYDVATSARPEEIRAVFGKRRTIPVGAAFGVITVLGPSKLAGQVEVATFRQDAAYSDGRHPDAVTFSTPEADAQRRDFTINGLFYDPVANEVIDYVGGEQDLERHVIRAIGNPAERFAEDKLRMLRAVRFAATFDFALDPATKAAILAVAGEITVVSVERIAAEMRLMLVHSSRARALSLLAEMGLLAVVLPEISLTSEAGAATLTELCRLAEPSFPLALAVAVHRFVDAERMTTIGARWKLSNKEINRALWLIKHKDSLINSPGQPWPRVQRLLIEDGIGELLAMHSVTHSDHSKDIAYCVAKLALPESELNPAPLLTGDDLAVHGIPPGKVYQQLLKAVRDAQLEGRINNASEAIVFVADLLKKKEGF